jgi:hypothetical protein
VTGIAESLALMPLRSKYEHLPFRLIQPVLPATKSPTRYYLTQAVAHAVAGAIFQPFFVGVAYSTVSRGKLHIYQGVVEAFTQPEKMKWDGVGPKILYSFTHATGSGLLNTALHRYFEVPSSEVTIYRCPPNRDDLFLEAVRLRLQHMAINQLLRASSELIVGVLLSPLATIRFRLEAQGADSQHPIRWTNAMTCFSDVLAEEGGRGFLNGIAAECRSWGLNVLISSGMFIMSKTMLINDLIAMPFFPFFKWAMLQFGFVREDAPHPPGLD